MPRSAPSPLRGQGLALRLRAVCLGLLPALLLWAPPTSLSAEALVVASPAPPPVDVAARDYGLRARALAPDVYVVEGANADFSVANGCNIINTGFIVTGDGVLVVNTGPSRRYGEQLRALMERTVPGRPVRQVLHLLSLQGHTGSDLVLVDEASGVAFVGGLVFVDRVPTTPHARIADWLASLDVLARVPVRAMVPSHGPVQSLAATMQALAGREGAGAGSGSSEPPVAAAASARGIAQTRDYLRWLDASFRRHADAGWAPAEVLRAPVPAAFRAWAAFDTEYVRNVSHLYPAYERQALVPLPPRP